MNKALAELQDATGHNCQPPLCVDLDGTLITSDLLFESLAALIRRSPISLFKLPFWLLRGRAYLKAKVAEAGAVDVGNLPYNGELIHWLGREKAAGRTLVLATAATDSLARAVFDHLGIFDYLIASSSTVNLRGSRKLEALRQRISGEFDYIGDSAADLPLFAASRRAICVSRFQISRRYDRTLSSRIEYQFQQHVTNRAALVLRELRVHQWSKNILVFLPLAAAHQLVNPVLLGKAFICFLAFCATASSVYILNDIVDLEADRAHAHKKFRPLASGRLPLSIGFLLAPVLLVLGLVGSLALSVQFAAVTLTYFSFSLLYTFVLKKLVLYDVFALAILYTVRLFAGQEAYGIQLSTWLVSCCFFLFQSLAFCKRVSELSLMDCDVKGNHNRRDYRSSDLMVVSCFGIASGLLASLVTVLYVESENVSKLYNRPEILWLLSPLLLQWLAHTWIKASRGMIIEDPVLYSLKDKTTWITLAAGAILIVAASL